MCGNTWLTVSHKACVNTLSATSTMENMYHIKCKSYDTSDSLGKKFMIRV